MTAVALSGIIRDLPEAEYHARPELSSSGARLLLPEYKGSPQKFQWEKTHKRTSRAFDVGTAAHAKVLGVNAGIVVYPDEHLTPSGNVSTSNATVAWEVERRDEGLTPVSPAELSRVAGMAEAVLAHTEARLYLEVAINREVSVFADVDGVPCRARLDAISDETRNGVYGLDLKTCEDATKNGLEYSVKKYGYDVQEAFYEDVYEASEGRPIDFFRFIAVEKSAPHEVTTYQLPTLWTSMGRTKAKEARRLFKECTESGVWPGYGIQGLVLDPPAWAVIEHEMRYDGEIQF